MGRIDFDILDPDLSSGETKWEPGRIQRLNFDFWKDLIAFAAVQNLSLSLEAYNGGLRINIKNTIDHNDQSIIIKNL